MKVKVRGGKYTVINWVDFSPWCMLYTHKSKKCIRDKLALYFRGSAITSGIKN